ncbi:hypothetical protein [Capybara microvirus Cap1_SP_90]|nr:hypothetical protein [Capybara microvirus Cap1_SP_90]
MFPTVEKFQCSRGCPVYATVDREVLIDSDGLAVPIIEKTVIDMTTEESIKSLGTGLSLKDALEAGISIDRVNTQVLSTSRADNLEKYVELINKDIERTLNESK